MFFFWQTIKSDRFQHVAHRAADYRTVVALTPRVHRPRDVRLFLQVVPRGVADVLPIGILLDPYKLVGVAVMSHGH